MTKAEKKAFNTMRASCALLVAAYRKADSDGGSVDWSDVDDALELAKRGLKEARVTIKKKKPVK